MVDRAFEEFLDSDDDALFLEASHHFLDYDSITESTQISVEKNAVQKQSEFDTSLYSKTKDNITSTEIQNNAPGTSKISPKGYEITVENIGSASVSAERCESIVKNSSKESKFSLGSNSSAVLCSSQKLQKEHVNDTVTNISAIATTSSECNSSEINLDKTPLPSDSSSYIDNRFTPGFTPKAKKRKLPGPAGLFELFNGSKGAMAGSSEEMLDMEFENIVSSQFTPEHLSLISWQKLQTAVSSCPNLHSKVKHYSIQRVLQESSKKKLPKHMVVPLLCVLLKKLSYKESTTISVFMDDTGEINGKIDSEVLSTYKEYFVEGTALILKKVTFLCNVLLLKAENIVSVYHPDGSEKHPQNLDSILKTSEPLKPMNCECSKLAHHSIKYDKHKMSSHNNVPKNHNVGCFNHSQNKFNNISDQNKAFSKIPYNNSPVVHKPNASYNQNKPNTVSSQNKIVNKNISNLDSDGSPHAIETSSQTKSVRSDAFLENLLDDDNCIDEFDELLGNLDEKSFMDDF